MNENVTVRIFIVAVAVAALAGLSYLAMSGSSGELTTAAVKEPLATTSNESLPQEEPRTAVELTKIIPEGSLISRVGEGSMMVLSIVPTRNKPILDSLGKLLQRVATTNAWKKLNIDKELGSRMQDPDLDYLFKDIQGSKNNSPEWFQMVRSLMMKVKEINFAVTSEVRNIHPNIKFPISILEVEFSDPTDLSQFHSGFVKGFREQLKKNPPKEASISFTDIDEATLLAEIKNKKKKINLQILSGVRGPRFYVMFGTSDKNTLMAPTGSPLVDSDQWRKLSRSLKENFGFFIYFNTGAFTSYIESIFEGIEPLIPAKDVKKFQEFRNNLRTSITSQGNIITAGSSEVTRAGVNASQCMTGDKGAFGIIAIRKYLKGKGKSNATHLLQRTLSEHSVFALALNTGFADLIFQNALQGMRAQAEIANGPDNNEVAKVLSLFTKFRGHLQSLGHREGSLFIDAPRSGFIPSGGIAMSGSALNAEAQAKIIRKILDEIGKESPAVERPVLTELSSNDDFLNYTLSIKPGAPGAHVVISQNGEFLLVTAGPEATRIARKPGIVNEFAKDFTGNVPGLNTFLEENDYIGYLNLAPAINVAKPSLGMLLSANPEAKIDFEDLSELLEIAKFRLFYAQQSALHGESTACYNTVMTVIPRN